MKKIICIFSPIFVVCLIFSSILPSVALSENISNKVFRLHILANSDSIEDQDLKLLIRDAILESTETIYKSCNSIEDAVNKTRSNLPLIEAISKEIVKNQGYNYDVKAYISKSYFDTREYDEFTLPAGIYDCIKVIIGEGRGHNWWCVMFPSVCLSGCISDFDKVLTKDEEELISNKNFKVKFKTIEIFEQIKSKIIS